MVQRLKTFQTLALVNTTIAEIPLVSHQASFALQPTQK